jgi:hypothetical protein
MKAFALFFTLAIALLCQDNVLQAQTRNDFSGWAAMFGTYRLNEKFGLHVEGQLRSNNEWERLQTYIIRVGLNYQVKKNMIATAGYAYIGNYRTVENASGFAPEQRIWEQFIINQSFLLNGHRTSIQNRFRLEQRFISMSIADGNQLKTSSYNFMQRFRYFARSIFPLNKTDAFKKGPYISLQDEVFFNIQNADVTTGHFFDQNRAYFSIGYRTAPQFDIEAGYMNQFILGRSTNVVNNILQLATYIRI